jgi:hypothetical protein
MGHVSMQQVATMTFDQYLSSKILLWVLLSAQ